MAPILPTGTDLTVSFTLRLPADASMRDVEDWLRFQLGANGTLHAPNALLDHDLPRGARDVKVVRMIAHRTPETTP